MTLSRLIPDVIRNQELTILGPNSGVRTAARIMAERQIGAVLVADEDGRLLGIFTERDLSFRVVAMDRDPDTTALREVMTADPDTLSPNDSPFAALDLMRQRRYRHLPIVENGQIVGMLSIRDLYAAVQSQMEDDLREREAFIFGESYTSGAFR